MEIKIKELYNNPKTGLVGSKKFHKKLHEKGISIDKENLKEILSSIPAYSLHKQLKKRIKRRKIIVFRVFEQLQADLVEINKANLTINENISYLLNVIDVLSKYAWTFPLKNKSGEEVKKAFEKLFREVKPEKIQVDKGTEFYNKVVKDFLKKNDVILFSTESDMKASIVERFNRTFKMMITRYMESKQTGKYSHIVNDIIENYNNSYNSSIGMKPIDAINPKNFRVLFRNYYTGHFFEKTKEPKLKANDIVRISSHKNVFEKETSVNWSIELFKIKKFFYTNPISYELEDLNNEPIGGRFYEDELQKVPEYLLKEPFEIEEILKTRKRGGITEVLVKYRGYGEAFNQWIPKKNITG